MAERPMDADDLARASADSSAPDWSQTCRARICRIQACAAPLRRCMPQLAADGVAKRDDEFGGIADWDTETIPGAGDMRVLE